jgi:hypothetical protein
MKKTKHAKIRQKQRNVSDLEIQFLLRNGKVLSERKGYAKLVFRKRKAKKHFAESDNPNSPNISGTWVVVEKSSGLIISVGKK